MSDDVVKIGLLGHGTVGSAFAELVGQRADAVEQATGRRPEISGVLTRSQGDFAEILGSSDVIVEVLGGLDPARDHVIAALEAGVPVITANKQLVSRCGPDLWAAAQRGGAQLRFEAAVAAVVPVIRVLTESLSGADIERVHGIVNGTTNFILSEMAATGAGYAEALKVINTVAGNAQPNTMTLQYFEALKKLGEGASTKYIFPMEFTGMLEDFLKKGK